MKKTFSLIIMICGLISVLNAQTVVDIVVNSEAHDTLEAAVLAAGLAETLAGEGPFTVFAPTDDAFAALPAGTIEALLEDPEGMLTDILLYHVVSGGVLSTDLEDGLEVETLNGANITVTISNDSVFINNALVTLADIEADNGVVHVIDAVLLPPEEEPLDSAVVILDFETPETSTGFQYFGSTIDGEFTDVIANPNPSGINTSDSVTVYLKPANSETWAGAFSNPNPTTMIDATNGGEVCIDVHMDHIGNLAFKLENGNGEQNWTTIVQNTVVNEWETLCFNFDSLSQDQTTVPATGNTYNTIVLFLDFGLNDTVDVTSYFDNIVVKPGEAVETTTVVDVIVGSEAHDTLEAAVIAAGLAETLAGTGPFTVFAPTDDAFAALPAGTIETLLLEPEGLLTDILLYHVASGNVLSTDLVDGMEVPTLNGADITISISNDSVFINDALVTLADIEADNGVVHVIDAVLLPPEEEPQDSGVVILDFETPETSTGFQYFGSTIDGEFTDVIANPNPSGINTSDSVTVYLKPANSETWAGAFSNPNPTTMIDATNGGEVCIDVHMDHIGNLAFKLENGNGEQNWTTIVQNTVVNEWETLCFNFDSLSQDQTTVPATGNTYNTIVLFFDFGLNDTVDVTSYFDNIVVKPGEAVETTTVVDVIVGSEAHDTLEAAVIAAGLAETLAGTGPFTVFAPTDDAFAALPAGTIETLLLEPEGLLTDILLYHVVSGNVLSTDLVDGMVVPTLNGADITVTISDDGVFINEALVIMADIQTDNGVVHVIDAVLLPPEEEPLDSAVVILDFETPETSTGFQYFGSTIDGEFTDVIANPNPSGINTSDSVTVYLKPANSQTWAGAFSNPGPAMMVDATNGGEVCIDVHMDHIGNLGFKLENGTAEQNWINVVENTVVNEWETLCFNFDSISFEEPFITATGNSYSTIVLFFDFGSNDVMDVTSYFDNIVLKPAATTTSKEIIDANTMDIKVFPNPTNGWLNIIVEDDYRFNKLEIIDLSGRVLYDKRVQGYNFKENISRIDEGMYVIRLTGDRITFSSSLIIRK